MIFGKTKIRRKKVRRQRVESSLSWLERYRRSVGLWPTVVMIVFSAAATAVTFSGQQSLRYSVGQKVRQPILARVDVEWQDDIRTEQNRQDARTAAPSFYLVNHRLIDEIGLSIQTLYQDAKAAETFDAFSAVAGPKGWKVDEALFGELRKRMDEQGSQDFTAWVDKLGELLQARYTYRPEDAKAHRAEATGLTVMVLPSDPAQPEAQSVEPVEVPTARLYPISNPELVGLLASDLAQEAGFPRPVLQQVVAQVLAGRLGAEPLLTYDRQRTEEAMEQAAQAVQPAVVTFKKGQALVSPGQGGGELVLTQEHMARLRAEHRQYQSLIHSDDPTAAPLREKIYLERAGGAAIIVLLSVCLFVYVGSYQHRILEVGARTISLTGLLLVMLVAARFLDVRFQHRELALLPALVVASCLAIAYTRRFAMGTMAIASLLLVIAVRGDIGLLTTLAVGPAVTVYMLQDIRTRTRIMTGGAATSAVVFLTMFAFGLIDQQGIRFAMESALWAAASAMAAALIVQGILPFIERVFRIATSLTLLEWSVADRPLLQRLAREAPGTYNHSLVIGTIGEAACEAIGANGLRMRVGALYHDIGKIHKADYFAENQEASINRHDNLAASMSLLIILGHVKDGVELAREYGLPRVLYPFIEEHHGTTVVSYFHHKASEQKKASGKHDREVSEAEFRYPGPKPRSKETAVIMLCDGVEGAVRAMPEPTAARIEGVVHKVVMDRLKDGQFSECDITLRELQTVEDSIVKSLCTFYHGRVAYPQDKAPKKKDQDEAPAEERPADLEPTITPLDAGQPRQRDRA
ncbi:MAG: HD family phosphohydrolase [Phycisphaerae bacterium]